MFYPVLSVVCFVGGESLFDSVLYGVPAVLVALISTLHEGSTLLRVYDQQEGRQGYFVFSSVATLALQDRDGFVRNCDRLFELLQTRRPIATIDLGSAP